MKKNQPKKLQLNRDTLVTLFEDKLAHVVGGVTGVCLPTSTTMYCPHNVTVSCTPRMC